MNILGLSFDYHDSAAALVQNGKIVAAAQEERFSRIKNDHSFPSASIKFCLKRAGILASGVDAVIYYEKPILKFDRIVSSALKRYCGREAGVYLYQTAQDWFQHKKFDVESRISEFMGIAADRIHLLGHHESHAAAAFYCSPFQESTIVTIDAVGEYETATVSIGRGNEIEKLYSVELPYSIGLFYSAFTAFLGFEVNEGEYKVMGLAGFGRPVYKDKIEKLIEKTSEGMFKLKEEYFEFLAPEQCLYTQKLIHEFGPPRKPESDFLFPTPGVAVASGSRESESLYYADIACSLQKCVEDVILHVVKSAIEITGVRDVSMAGGVALNSVANGRLQKELNCRLYVQPAAGDAGSALGSALHYYHTSKAVPRINPFTNMYLGEEYSNSETKQVLEKHNLTSYVFFENIDDLIADVAAKLENGAVVGWMQGRFEWGPRALGNRSILANPLRAEMKEIVNRKIKFREPFRPFAPSVLAEHALEYFEIPTPHSNTSPEYFMLAVGGVKPEKRAVIPAVTHADGTARVHLVTETENPLYYRLIQAFGDRTGIPMVMNTSFNLRGEPIVNTPFEALRTFSWSDMDFLAIGNYLVMKEY